MVCSITTFLWWLPPPPLLRCLFCTHCTWTQINRKYYAFATAQLPKKWPHFIFNSRNEPQELFCRWIHAALHWFGRSHMLRASFTHRLFFVFSLTLSFVWAFDAFRTPKGMQKQLLFADSISIIAAINSHKRSSRIQERTRERDKSTVWRLQLRFWTWKNLELEFLASNTHTQCTQLR